MLSDDVAAGSAPTSTKATGEPRPGFRPDIDGLRAVAILMVVAYHVAPAVVSGGFVGVDVFFVISGFLITGKLLGEVSSTASVRLGSFWAGRVRRLVPALALMVGVVLVVSLFVLGATEWNRAANEGIASLLYVSNLVFAYQATNYFAANVNSSLFLHTWSLGVEEQFYLVWPVLLLVVGRVLRRRRTATASAVGGLLAAIAVASFALAVALTARGTPWSFFSLPTRAWEFAAGGILACLARRAVPLPARAHAALGVAGLALIGVATFVLADTTPFPGVATLLPVVGTMALIYSGDGRRPSPVASVLALRPPQWLGRVSYAWYLWHWPIMLLAVAWLDRDSVGVRIGAVVVALGIASVARRLVENPIRFSPSLAGRPARTFAVGASITVIGLVVATGVKADAQRTLSDPFYARLAAAEASGTELDADASCRGQRSAAGVEYCAFGDPNGATTVLLTGDSHAAHWIPAFDEAASDLGIKLVVHTRGGCPSVPASIALSVTRLVPSSNCSAFRADTASLIDETRPSAVVLANADYVGRILDDRGRPDADRQLALWQQAVGSAVRDLRAGGRRVGVVLENPVLPTDPNICLGRKQSIDACRPSRSTALGDVGRFNDAQRAGLAAIGGAPVPTLDVSTTLCDDDHCDLEHDGALVYRDGDHLTTVFVRTQLPAVTELLRSITAPA